MELEFQEMTTQYLRRLLSKTQFHEEETELALPDSYPDADRVLTGSAVVTMRGKEQTGTAITVTGAVHADVLYAAQEGGELWHMEAYLPFTLRVDAPEASDGAVLEARPWVRSVDTRIASPRRLVTRVNIGCTVEAYEPAAVTFYQPQDVPQSVQLRMAQYPLTLAVDAGEKQFRLTEEIELPPGAKLGETILSYSPQLEITERRLAGNKAAFKGMAHLHVLYTDETGKPTSHDARFPFSQYCELGEVYDDETLEVIPVVTECEVSRVTRAAGSALGLDLHVLAQCLVLRRTSVPVCEDAYCLQGELTPQREEIVLPGRLDSAVCTCSVREQIPGDVREVIDAQALPDQPELRRSGGDAELAIPCTASVLYYDSAGLPQSATMHIRSAEPFALAENASCDAQAMPVLDLSVSATADGAEVRCTLAAQTVSSATERHAALRGVEVTDAAEKRRSAVVARRCAAGETLWDIAKANRTTVDRIRRANGIEGNDVPTAAMLLIPV